MRGNVLQKEDKEVSSGSGEIDRVVVIELRKELGVVPEQEEWSGESDDVLREYDVARVRMLHRLVARQQTGRAKSKAHTHNQQSTG